MDNELRCLTNAREWRIKMLILRHRQLRPLERLNLVPLKIASGVEYLGALRCASSFDGGALISEFHWNASSDFMEISRCFIQIPFYAASVVWLKMVFVWL